MPFILLCIVTAIYFYVAGCFVLANNWPMAVVYGGYAVANFGLIAMMSTQ